MRWIGLGLIALTLAGCGGEDRSEPLSLPQDLVAARPAGPHGPLVLYDVRAGARRFALPPGLLSADGQRYLAAVEQAGETELAAFDPVSGARRLVASLHGRWELRGLSPSGDRAALRTAAPGGTRIVVVDVLARRVGPVVRLRGDYDVDALAGNDRSLFLVERLGGDDYRIVLYDLHRRAVDGPVVEKGADQVMTGYAWGGVGTSDGKWLLTLYLSTSRESAFVHALDLSGARPACIFLPSRGGIDALRGYSLALSPDQRTLYAANPALGVVAAIDLATQRVVATIDFQPVPAQGPGPAAVSPDGGRLALGAGAGGLLVDVRSGETRDLRAGGRVVGVGFGRGGDLVYAVRSDGRIAVLEA